MFLSVACKGGTNSGSGGGAGGNAGSPSAGAGGATMNTGGSKSSTGGTGGKTGGTGGAVTTGGTVGKTGGTGGTVATGGTGGGKTGGTGGTVATGGTGGGKTGGTGGTVATGGTGGSKTGGTGGTVATGGTGGGNVGGLAGSRNRARAFLSGHSLIDSPIDTYVLDIATKKGDDYKYNLQNIVGSPIRIRTRGNGASISDWSGYSMGKNLNGSGMNVINELRNPATLGAGEKYDTLVITERHDLPDSIQWESTTSLLRHYHDRLLAGSGSAQTLLYHCWQSMNKDDPSAWLAYEKAATPLWECITNKVNLTLEANNLPKAVVNLPASKALVVLVERAIAGEVPGVSGSTREKMNAFFKDDVHLTDLGSYFAASVIYSGLFRKTPEGAAIPAGLAQNTAVYLQKLAWEQVQSYYSTADSGQHTMAQCRTIAATACPLYWTLKGDGGKAATCAGFWNNQNDANNPFRWPDNQLVVWPAP